MAKIKQRLRRTTSGERVQGAERRVSLQLPSLPRLPTPNPSFPAKRKNERNTKRNQRTQSREERVATTTSAPVSPPIHHAPLPPHPPPNRCSRSGAPPAVLRVGEGGEGRGEGVQLILMLLPDFGHPVGSLTYGILRFRGERGTGVTSCARGICGGTQNARHAPRCRD